MNSSSGPEKAPCVVFVESSYTGAGEDVARAALALGLVPILLCRDPSPYAFACRVALEVRETDTTSVDGVLAACAEIACERDIRGVGTTDDYSTVVAAAAARCMGLPCPQPDSVEKCADKGRMRTALRGSGLNPAWRLARDVDAAVDAARAVGLPVVVKPSRLTGGMLVRRCDRIADVARHAAKTLGSVAPGAPGPVRDLLVEDVVSGPEFSVEVIDGRVIGVTAKHLTSGPNYVELGHDFPAPISPELRATLGAAATRTVAALGLTWGAAHVELKCTGGEVNVLEVNPRIGGGRISDLIRLASGFQYARAVVSGLVGNDHAPPGRAEVSASVRFLCPVQTGRLVQVAGLAEARNRPGVDAVELFVEPGHVRPRMTRSNLDRLGFAIATGPDVRVAAGRAHDALARVRLTWDRA